MCEAIRITREDVPRVTEYGLSQFFEFHKAERCLQELRDFEAMKLAQGSYSLDYYPKCACEEIAQFMIYSSHSKQFAEFLKVGNFKGDQMKQEFASKARVCEKK